MPTIPSLNTPNANNFTSDLPAIAGISTIPPVNPNFNVLDYVKEQPFTTGEIEATPTTK